MLVELSCDEFHYLLDWTVGQLLLSVFDEILLIVIPVGKPSA